MSRLVFLLEEYSAKVLLDALLPRLFPRLRFLCVPHEGRRDLETSIPRKLRAWREPGVRFCVLRDNDGSDCVALKERLLSLCRDSGREDTLVRIACQEIEAWYFGAPHTLAEAFGKPGLKELHLKTRFRDPDAVPRPSQALAELVPEFQKVAGARRLGPLLDRNNTSASFQALVSGLDRIVRDLQRTPGEHE
jgi:hypothetical protein